MTTIASCVSSTSYSPSENLEDFGEILCCVFIRFGDVNRHGLEHRFEIFDASAERNFWEDEAVRIWQS